jgi:hypothetical protein
MNAEFFDFGKVVKLSWEDSASICGWRPGPRRPEFGAIESIGWVVGCSETGITISTSLNDEQSCICPISIPWSCVTEIKEVESNN